MHDDDLERLKQLATQLPSLVRFVATIPGTTYAGNFAAHFFAQTPRGTRRT
jgi:hypothetical protein